MSTFRNTVSAMVGKEAYFLLGEKPMKATITKINDDLAVLKLSAPTSGYSELAIHIDMIILITAA